MNCCCKTRLLPLLLILLLTLGGCATTAPVPQSSKEASWQLQQQKVGGLAIWELAGRISVQLEKEGWSASLYWWQDNSDYKLRIVAPLGRGTVEITGNKEQVRLQMADNQVFENQGIDQMMQQNLGWEIPVDALVYWVRGLPDPGSKPDNIDIDADGRLAGLHQDGWDIHYEKYTNVGGFDVPSRMTVEREQLRLRLGINRWTLPDAS